MLRLLRPPFSVLAGELSAAMIDEVSFSEYVRVYKRILGLLLPPSIYPSGRKAPRCTALNSPANTENGGRNRRNTQHLDR